MPHLTIDFDDDPWEDEDEWLEDEEPEEEGFYDPELEAELLAEEAMDARFDGD